jgi:hypothetical protein
MICRINIFLIALMFSWPVSVVAAEAARDESPVKTVKIVLHPMGEPRPALKYKLLPSYIDLKPGNAALFYNKIPAESHRFFADSKMWEKACDWMEAPLAELQKDDVRKTINSWNGYIKEIKRASLCESCDWQFTIREDGYAVLLPDLQEIRSYARLLAPYARLQIADGKFDEAVKILQAGYALGRHVGNESTMLVQALIGCAITNMMSAQIQEFIQQPDAPNLYWALTNLPDPVIDFRSSFEAESDMFYLCLPDLRDLDKKEMSPDQWRVLLNQSIKKMCGVIGQANGMTSELVSAFSTVILLEKYPRAKSFLIERGWPADKVEAMPVCQVIIIAALRQYDEIRDDMFKGINLPYPEASGRSKKWESKFQEIIRSKRFCLLLVCCCRPSLPQRLPKPE